MPGRFVRGVSGTLKWAQLGCLEARWEGSGYGGRSRSELSELARESLGVGFVDDRVLHHLQFVDLPLDLVGGVGHVLLVVALDAEVLLLATQWRLLAGLNEDALAQDLA